VGALSIGFFADSKINPAGNDGWINGNFSQVWIQIVGVLVAVVWAGLWTTILLFLFRFSKFFKLTVEREVEALGLDHYYHGDVAYHHLETEEYERTSSLHNEEDEEGEPHLPKIHLEDEEATPLNRSRDGSVNSPGLDLEIGGLHISPQVRQTLSARYAAEHGEVHV
jgi:hypothetical protein